jgi:hypothetical protein
MYLAWTTVRSVLISAYLGSLASQLLSYLHNSTEEMNTIVCLQTNIEHTYVARPQSKFPARPTASKPYIARSDCAYVTEQCCSMAHALTVLPAFSQ